MDQASLRLEHVAATWCRTTAKQQSVASGIDLDLARGEWCVILGDNGLGKSTLLHAIAGTCPYVRGRIHLLGHLLDAKSPYQRFQLGLQFVPHEVTCPNLWSVEDLKSFVFEKRPSLRHPAVGDLVKKLTNSRFLASKNDLFRPHMARLFTSILSCPSVILFDEISPLLAGFESLSLGYEYLRKELIPAATVIFTEHASGVPLDIADKALILEAKEDKFESWDRSRVILKRDFSKIVQIGSKQSFASDSVMNIELPLLSKETSARDHIQIAKRASILSESKQAKILKSALKWWDYLDDPSKPVDHFSGGMKVITHAVMSLLVSASIDSLKPALVHLHVKNRDRLATLQAWAREIS